MKRKPKLTYQIYCDRNDGVGLSLSGCWGSEHANFETEAEGLEALKFLAKDYPDCDWALLDSDDYEVKRIPASVVEDEDEE